MKSNETDVVEDELTISHWACVYESDSYFQK